MSGNGNIGFVIVLSILISIGGFSTVIGYTSIGTNLMRMFGSILLTIAGLIGLIIDFLREMIK